MRRLRDRLARARGDAGFSLVELVVAMAIGSVVLAAVGTFVVGSLKVVRVVTAHGTETADARIAMDAVARRLRLAVVPPGQTSALVLAEQQKVQFYASLRSGGDPADPAPTLLTYEIDSAARCLRETQIAATGAYPYTWPVASARSRCLIEGLFNQDGRLVFNYYDTSTSPLPLDLLTAAASKVDSIGLTMTVVDPRFPAAHAVYLATRVSLFNLSRTD